MPQVKPGFAPGERLTWSRIARRIRVPLGFLLAAFYLWRARPMWSALLGGAVIILLGVAVRAVASGHVKKNEELTRTGPYAYVRNPLYLGSILVAAGFVVAARDIWVAVAIAAVFVLVYVPVILSEEAFLRSRFPHYSDYAASVPRLLPRTLALSGFAGGFSRELYLKHREYNVLLGAGAMLAALAVKTIWVQR